MAEPGVIGRIQQLTGQFLGKGLFPMRARAACRIQRDSQSKATIGRNFHRDLVGSATHPAGLTSMHGRTFFMRLLEDI